MSEIRLSMEIHKEGTPIETVLELAIELLQQMPHFAVQPAHEELMLSVPVFTGRYQEGIQVSAQATNKLVSEQVSVSPESLAAAGPDSPARVHGSWTEISADEYIHGKADPAKATDGFDINEQGSRPYIERIEAIGSPMTDLGQGMWASANLLARHGYEEILLALRSINP